MSAVRRLGDILDIASGQVDPTVPPYSDMPHVGGEDIETDTGRILDSSTARELGLISGKYLFGKSDILYSKIRPNLNKVAVPSFEGICSADIYPLRPRPAILCREFLAHLLRSNDFLTYTRKHSSRTNIPKLNREGLLSYEVLLPPLAEQRRIAEVLDRAEALRAKRRAALAQLDSLTQALFLDLFGDAATNPKRWRVSLLGDASDVQGGLQISSARKPYPTEVPYLRVANVHRGSLDLTEIKTLRATDAEILRTALMQGDLLVVEGHGNPDEIGRAALWDGSIARCVHQNHIIRVRLDGAKLLPGYACEYLNSPGGRRHLLRAGKTTSGLNTISVSEVRAAPVAVPPLSLQQEFVRRVSGVEKLRVAHRASLAEMDALFASLQHRAFRGEL